MRQLKTHLHLPPGIPSRAVAREFLRRVFEEYRWFKPMRFGLAIPEERIDPDHIDYDSLLAFYDEFKALCVAARTDRDFFLLYPAKPAASPHTGALIWRTSVKESAKPSWLTAHQRQVVELMHLMDSPLAQAAADDDYARKTQRLVPAPDGFGSMEEATVRDYGEGLAGLFWRNFFGSPFVRLFGERLTSLPSEFKQELGGGIVLVQPYALPTQAGTPEASALERQLIQHLGPECFYDHEHHRKPTRVPELPPPPA